jgi:hypothetical protein
MIPKGRPMQPADLELSYVLQVRETHRAALASLRELEAHALAVFADPPEPAKVRVRLAEMRVKLAEILLDSSRRLLAVDGVYSKLGE